MEVGTPVADGVLDEAGRRFSVFVLLVYRVACFTLVLTMLNPPLSLRLAPLLTAFVRPLPLVQTPVPSRCPCRDATGHRARVSSGPPFSPS